MEYLYEYDRKDLMRYR